MVPRSRNVAAHATLPGADHGRRAIMEQQEKPRLARRFAALLGFFRSEAAGGAVLIAAAIAALIWSNSAASPDYFALLDLPLAIGIGRAAFSQSLFHGSTTG